MIQSIVQRTDATTLSVLDVASGDGYILKTLQQEFAATGIDLRITLLDRILAHFTSIGSFPKIAGDALRLPFADSTFDLVSCSLFVHHLPPQQAVVFAKDARRVAVRESIINALIMISAGTAGCASAISDVRDGARVLLVEAARFSRQEVCGEFVSAASLGLLERLVVGNEGALLFKAPWIGTTR